MATARISDTWTQDGLDFIKMMRQLDRKPAVQVGFPEKDFAKAHKGQKKDEAYTVGMIAVVNEFGTAPGTLPKIPERSFMRSSYDKNIDAWKQDIDILFNSVIWGKRNTGQAMGLLGEIVKKEIVAEIHRGGTPFTPNAPSTIAAKTRGGKKGDHPLNDTGQMAQSVTYEKVNCE